MSAIYRLASKLKEKGFNKVADELLIKTPENPSEDYIHTWIQDNLPLDKSTNLYKRIIEIQNMDSVEEKHRIERKIHYIEAKRQALEEIEKKLFESAALRSNFYKSVKKFLDSKLQEAMKEYQYHREY